jgi:hypothetical protein
MAVFPKTNILVTGRNIRNINHLQNYLDIVGNSFYQSSYNLFPDRCDFLYFLGDSAVLIKKFKTKVDIRMCASDQEKLSKLKTSIENILSGLDDDPIST